MNEAIAIFIISMPVSLIAINYITKRTASNTVAILFVASVALSVSIIVRWASRLAQ